MRLPFACTPSAPACDGDQGQPRFGAAAPLRCGGKRQRFVSEPDSELCSGSVEQELLWAIPFLVCHCCDTHVMAMSYTRPHSDGRGSSPQCCPISKCSPLVLHTAGLRTADSAHG